MSTGPWYVTTMDGGIVHEAPSKREAVRWVAHSTDSAQRRTRRLTPGLYEFLYTKQQTRERERTTYYIGRREPLIADGFRWAFEEGG